ncbi:MAG TPA: hypothetical protein VG838_06165 [Opitutaceae bacterium]|nr:hypothetical protein [Opitutaceae bacterium]
MTLRRQILLGITPVFAALALVGNGVRYYLERKATLDGLRQEAGTFAISLATFARPDDWASLENNHPDQTLYPAALDRLHRWNMLRGFVLWHGRTHQALFQWGNADEVPPASGAFLQQLGPDRPYAASDLVATSDGTDIVFAYALLRDAAKHPLGIVGVSVDASDFTTELADVRRNLVRSTLLVTALGMALSLALATRLSFELRRLTRAAAGIEKGDYVPPPAGLIADISDVSDTFGVLDGVIDEVRAKSNRAFVENEQFRTEGDLLRVFRDEFMAPATIARADLQVGMAVTGSSPAIFREPSPQPGVGRICFGRVAGEAGLETAILASATGREIEDRLARGDDPAAALVATAGLFPLQSATILTWTAGGAEVLRWDFAAGEVRRSQPALAAGTLVCHDFPPATAAAVDLYLRRFPGEKPAQWLTDIVQLAGDVSGTVLVLSRT